MTFYRGLCDDVFDTLGRDATLRHAYRVYLWRRAVGFVHLSAGPTADAEFYSQIKAFPPSKMQRAGRGARAADGEQAPLVT